MIETGNYDSVTAVIKDALNRGGVRDMGHDYKEGFAQRGQKSVRRPMSTGWPVLDKAFNGGWERATLSTFIAPTGAGKSMFLVNCGAAALEQGLNVAYVSLEMADWKIGLRFDSYYSGVDINSVADNQDQVKVEVNNRVKGQLFIKEWPTKTASVQTIRAYLQRLSATKNFIPDMVLVDYADLLRGSSAHKDKRFELEGIYEELRALAQEFNIVVITADQTNRSGLDMEIVTIGQIGESYAKATVCDVIMTISRRMEDKQFDTGRIFLAKSRLGQDGIVFPFTLKTATVRATLLEQGADPIAMFMQNNQNRNERMADRYAQLVANRKPDAAQ
jgi:replicative DNA helicase